MELDGMTPKARRRFYEPIVLYQALAATILAQTPRGASKSGTSMPLSAREQFETFVYKLAMVCDNQKGGTTVCSFSVLKDNEGILYVFGCNQVDATVLVEMEDFVGELLSLVAAAGNAEPTAQRRHRLQVLKKIMEFGKPRIQIYLERLQEEAKNCIKVCRFEQDEQLADVEEGLTKLLKILARASPNSSGSRLDFDLKTALQCLAKLQTMVKERAYKMVTTKAKEERALGQKSAECWSELQHYISRLLAYDHAAAISLQAQREWPELFEGFRVLAVPSSKKLPNPLGKKSESAYNIAGRMLRAPSEIGLLRDCCEQLQVFDLDARLQQACSELKPYVHSEVLVFDWLKRNMDNDGLEFFGGWKYIGASKPTCQLCAHFFDAHNGLLGPRLRGFKVRPTHGNIYHSWRQPDLYGGQGTRAAKDRQEVTNRIMVKIRGDAMDIVHEKSPKGKKHDTNTYGGTHMEELQELFRQKLNLTGSSSELGPEPSEMAASAESDFEDEIGCKL